MRNSQIRAEEIFNAQQPAVEQYRKMGVRLTPIMAATVEQIKAHIDLVESVSGQYGPIMDFNKVQFGATADEIAALAQAKAKHYRQGAGYRALQVKYGDEAAKNIVRKHAGK